jgi:glycerophosphoryl diester phosphodiesterase
MEKVELKTVIDSSKKKRPLIFAHRGACREAPENTIPAFERALELGCDGIEFDVLLTRDKVPLVTHNDDLSILTHFEGMVHDTPFSIIKSLDFGSHFRLSYSNVTAPTLTEVLELLWPRDIYIICEIKGQPGMAFHSARLISGIISDFKFRHPIILSSKESMILYHLKRLAPGMERALIVQNGAFSFLKTTVFAKFFDVSEIHANLRVLNPYLVKNMHSNGRKVGAWTINKNKDIDYCLSCGVDSIITDDVAMAKSYLDSK